MRTWGKIVTSLNIESKKTRPITVADLKDPAYAARVEREQHEYVMWLLETLHEQAVRICELETKLKALGH